MNEEHDVGADGSADAPYDTLPEVGTAYRTGLESRQETFAVPGFDAVARMISSALHVPLVALVLVDGGTFYFTPGATDTPAIPARLQAFLRSAVARDTPSEALDIRAPSGGDAANPRKPLRFFASVPVHTLTHRHVAALCVVDFKPRLGLDEVERGVLADAATLAGTGIVLGSYIGRVDPVTRLPHRNAFFEDVRTRASQGAETLAIVAIDVAPVSRFNAFVRAMGHHYADALIRLVAMRVQEWMQPDMRLYQVGVTRFALLLTDTRALADSVAFDRLVALLRKPLDCQGIPISIQPGVGLLAMPAHEIATGDALRLVMSAAYAAQRSIRGWSVYEPAQDMEHQQEFFLVTELAAAVNDPQGIAARELDLHYQPRVDLRSGRCVAVEALMRWHHPSLGTISPGRFVPLAEQAGLIRALTDWVFHRGLGQLAVWIRNGLDIKLSLNVSSTDFEADLVPRLQAMATHHGVPLDRIELEFTENTFMRTNETIRQRLGQLSQLGVGIAIDDFGTGYSNLAYMRKLPASTLKIDQSFVSAIDSNAGDAVIVRSIATMARKLGFRVVVEGVETESILHAVMGMDCDEMQGYFIARPMSAADLPGWLETFAARGGLAFG